MSFHDVLGQETVDYTVEEISKSDARFFPLRQFGNATCRKCAETQRAEMQSAVTVLNQNGEEEENSYLTTLSLE